MLVFSTSDKGGTGRSVTTSNIMYRTALTGVDVSYLDFDFGSPTVGSIFAMDAYSQGTDEKTGLHSYLLGRAPKPEAVDIWSNSDRDGLRHRTPGSGRMVLLPGETGGAEFQFDDGCVDRCLSLLLRMEEEFDISFIDLSAGRSYALSMVLQALGRNPRTFPAVRFLVFHRWTRQHVVAAGGLVHGERGILDYGKLYGLPAEEMTDRVRFVRTAVIDPNAPDLAGLRPAQLAWLQERNKELGRMASRSGLGRAALLGSVPLDPVLQWQEQLLTDNDVLSRHVANQATVDAFTGLAERIADDSYWQPR